MTQLFAHHFSARGFPSFSSGPRAAAGVDPAGGGSRDEAPGDSFPAPLLNGALRLPRGAK